MSATLLIVTLVVLFAGGGYRGHRSYGPAGLSSALILWLLGAIGGAPMRI